MNECTNPFIFGYSGTADQIHKSAECTSAAHQISTLSTCRSQLTIIGVHQTWLQVFPLQAQTLCCKDLAKSKPKVAGDVPTPGGQIDGERRSRANKHVPPQQATLSQHHCQP